MEDNLNTQQSPEQPIYVTQRAIEHLRDAMPWMRFIALFGMVMCGLTFLGGLILMVSMSFGIIFFIIYAIIVIIAAVPLYYLLEYSNRLKNFLNSKEPVQLELAFERQKSYWLYLGISLSISIAIGIIFFIISLVIRASV